MPISNGWLPAEDEAQDHRPVQPDAEAFVPLSTLALQKLTETNRRRDNAEPPNHPAPARQTAV